MQPSNACAFSPDESMLAFWDASTGQQTSTGDTQTMSEARRTASQDNSCFGLKLLCMATGLVRTWDHPEATSQILRIPSAWNLIWAGDSSWVSLTINKWWRTGEFADIYTADWIDVLPERQDRIFNLTFIVNAAGGRGDGAVGRC